MVFSQPIFFLVFLTLNLIFYAFARTIQAKNIVMIVFSLMFYTWGEPKYVLLLLAMVFVNWMLSLMVGAARSKSVARLGVVLSCVFSLGMLGIFKYTNFITANIAQIFNLPDIVTNIALPIGISFYTFQILSYVVDVYKREVPAQRSFWKLLLYISLFHQCIAGPIVRYQDVAKEIDNRKVTLTDLSRGITRFAVGLGKKALLANVCAEVGDKLLLTDAVASNPDMLSENLALLADKPAGILWLGMLMYMLHIYLDFSAYSDMAIGMGLMIGFHYKENFDYPYTASSVTQFWRKWHISLSSFFRDYVYIPLGGNRKGLPRKLFNMLVVWFLTGLWHGASWNFVLWGLYFFVFLLIENLGFAKVLNKIPSVFGHVYLLIVVYFGWILFRFTNIELAWTVVKGLFCGNGNDFTSFETGTVWLNYIFFLIVAVISVTPLIKKIGHFLETKAETNKFIAVSYGVAQIIIPVALLVLSTISLIGDSYNPFIYYRF